MNRCEQSIIDFVTGKITFDKFGQILDDNPEIWESIQSFLTLEMIEDRSCPFWTATNFQVLYANNYSVAAAVSAFGYKSELGQLRLHSLFSDLVEYRYPNIKRKSPPSQSPDDILYKLRMDYIGGPETDEIAAQLIREVPEDMPKKDREKLIRQSLRDTFHIVPRKVPCWAQSPEWPMGTSSPMAFLGQKQDGDLVRYAFQDVDTEQTIIIEQLC